MTREEFYTIARDTGIIAAYAAGTGRPDWAERLDALIPGYMHGGIVNWIILGQRPGGFLCAVIEGDLYDAYGRADDVNAAKLRNYVHFLYNYAPAGCFRRGTLDTWKGLLPE